MRLVPLALLLVAACGDDVADPPLREVVLVGEVDGSGLSPELRFTIPEGTRSVTIVVEGDPEALYALGAFTLGDGADRVGLPAGPPGEAMRAAYEDEEIGQMPGGLYQSIRLGTFTHVFPYRPDQEVLPGAGSLRVASTRAGPVTVRLLLPEDDGVRTLPLNLYVVSATLADPDTEPFVGELTRIFAQADLAVELRRVERLTGTSLERITESTEPQEAPGSPSARLPGLVADRDGPGLDVFFVESLPFGIGGLSLGTPGPPVRGSYYFGVVVRGSLPAVELARVTAHEVAHFLALQHVENRGVSGAIYPDPLDDTVPGAGNLMERGTLLTADQAFALSRSALLVAP
jgi:hypothetical protein